jgi:hypothetical protein
MRNADGPGLKRMETLNEQICVQGGLETDFTAKPWRTSSIASIAG